MGSIRDAIYADKFEKNVSLVSFMVQEPKVPPIKSLLLFGEKCIGSSKLTGIVTQVCRQGGHASTFY